MVKIDSLDKDNSASFQNEARRRTSKFVFWHRTRVGILVLVMTCMTLLLINSQIFTFTVICMDDVIVDHQISNVTGPHWIQGSFQKSIVFSSTAIGAILGLIPSVRLLHNFGVRNSVSIYGIFSIIGTLFFPLAVSYHFYAVCFCRFLQGLGISILLTLIGVIPNIWAPKNESSTFLAILSTPWQLSSIIFMPISGVLCDSFMGWRSIYYIFGAVSLIVLILFYLFYGDSPRSHKNVSEKELQLIEDGKIAHVKEPVPYRAVCSDLCVLATWLGFFGGNIGFITLLLYGPTYLREVLHFDIRSTGLASSLPWLLCAIWKTVVGKLSDKLTFVSEKTKFTSWMFSAVVGLSVGYIVMAVTKNRLVAQIAFTLAIVASGLRIMGSIRCLQLRCRQHTHFAMAGFSLISYLVQFLAPLLVAFVCPDNTPGQWSVLFIIISVAMIAAFIPFPFLTTAEPAHYTIKKEKDSAPC